MIRRIHVNQHKIRSNIDKPEGEKEPVITVKTYKSNDYGFTAEFTEGVIKYRPDNPLSCGARLWVETQQPVILDGKKI